MARRSKLSDPEAERLLSGRSGDEDPETRLLAAVVEDVRGARAARPRPEVEAAHLAAIARLSGDGVAALEPPAEPLTTTGRTRRVMTRRRFAIQLAGAALAAVLGTAGLAVAGVTLPAPAQDAFSAAGIELPNQAGGTEPSQGGGSSVAVHAVIDATAPQDRGCEFGQQVAAAVRNGAAQGPQGDPCSGGGPDEAGAHGGSAPTAGRDFGESTSAAAQDSASSDGRGFGEGTSQGAQSLGDGLSQGGAGPDAGGDESTAGQEHAEAGAGNAPSVP